MHQIIYLHNLIQLVACSGGGPITGQQYISLLDIFKPKIVWDDECGEHQLLYGDGKEKHVVFYPTLKSIAARIDEAKHYGTGLSIWEIGQGLEYFFDLLWCSELPSCAPELQTAEFFTSH